MPRTSGTWTKDNPSPKAFKPGQSGNPGGRPKSDVVSLARQHTPEAINRLVALMRQDDDFDIAIQATTALLDRGWGKPPQALLAQVNGNVTITGIDKPPEITESYESWLERIRNELDLLERESKSLEAHPAGNGSADGAT
jgi:hypothetical protein